MALNDLKTTPSHKYVFIYVPVRVSVLWFNTILMSAQFY